MANPAYGKCYPYEASDQKAYEAEWRHLAGAWGDGIVNSFGPAFNIVGSSGNRTVTLSLSEFRMRGIHFEPTTASVVLTLPAVTGTKVRADRIIAKLDPVAKSITFVVKTGAEITSGTPAPPALSRISGGVWEHSLWVIRGGNVASASLDYTDQRIWLHQTYKGVGPPTQSDELTFGVSDGARYIQTSNDHEWMLSYPAGVPTWEDLDTLTWNAFPLAGTPGNLLAYFWTPLYSKRRNIVTLRGGIQRKAGALLVAAKSSSLLGTLPLGYRPELQCQFSTTTTFAYGSSGSGRLTIDTNGAVTFSPETDVTWARIDCMFPVEG